MHEIPHGKASVPIPILDDSNLAFLIQFSDFFFVLCPAPLDLSAGHKVTKWFQPLLRNLLVLVRKAGSETTAPPDRQVCPVAQAYLWIQPGVKPLGAPLDSVPVHAADWQRGAAFRRVQKGMCEAADHGVGLAVACDDAVDVLPLDGGCVFGG